MMYSVLLPFPELGERGLAADGALALADEHAAAGRQVEVDTRAEPDMP